MGKFITVLHSVTEFQVNLKHTVRNRNLEKTSFSAAIPFVPPPYFKKWAEKRSFPSISFGCSQEEVL